MRVISRLISIALFATASSAFADDLFADGVPRDIKKYSSVAHGTTMGGYPLYQGGHEWKLITHESNTNNLNMKIARVHLASPDASGYLAQMFVTTNLTQAMEEGWYSGDACDQNGSALHTINKSAGKRDNCMTLRPYNVPLNGRDSAAMLITVRNSQSNWRLYSMTLLINPVSLGFPNTLVDEWSRDSIAQDPKKRKFIENLSTWAGHLQDAVNAAIGYDKPQDAFSNVPSIRSLADSNTKVNTASN